MRYPTNGNAFIPSMKPPSSPSIEYVRKHGVIVYNSGNGRATVETEYDGAINFCACTLDADGNIQNFAFLPSGNRWVQVATKPREASDDEG